MDDDYDVLWSLGRMLVRHGFEVTTAGDGVEAIERLEESEFCCAVVDVQMLALNGLAVLAWIQRFRPATPVVVMTAYGNATVREVALRNGALTYLEKPVDPSRLLQLLSLLNQRTTSFSGLVTEIDLFDYLQLLMVTNRSLVLALLVSTGSDAKLWLTEGNIVHAELGEIAGEEAVYACLALPGGRFAELPWSAPEKRTIAASGTHILMEAARRKDECTAAQKPTRASWIPASTEQSESDCTARDPNEPEEESPSE